MPTTFWIGNQRTTAQVDTLTITAAGAAGDTVIATINTKNVTYTVVSGDTTSTVASGLLALLQSASAPPEFQELSYTVSSNVITCTAAVPGTPFTMTAFSTGGATIVHAVATTNQSPSDVNDAKNWLRSGVNSIPQNGDDVVVADSTVPLLWNLTALAAVTFASYTRWQNFTGQIGLPENNPNGYYEYRPTYFQFIGSAGTFTMQLGIGQIGTGPTLEKYDNLAQQTNVVVLASGAAQQDFNIYWKGSNASNVLSIVGGVSVAIGMLPAETATLASATVDGGALSLGSGVTFSGTLTVNGGTSTVLCAPATLSLLNGAIVNVEGLALTYATVTARSGSRLNWLANGTITTLTLTVGAILDKSADVRAMTITNSTIDGDTCQVLDPFNAITWTNATTINNQVFTGPFTFATGRSVKIT